MKTCNLSFNTVIALQKDGILMKSCNIHGCYRKFWRKNIHKKATRREYLIIALLIYFN